MNRRLCFAWENISFSSSARRAVEPEIVLSDLLSVNNEDVRGQSCSRTTLYSSC